MIELHLPWLELSIVIPLIGSLWVGRLRDPGKALKWCLVFSSLTLICATGAWLDFSILNAEEARDCWSSLWGALHLGFPVIDHFSAPLLPLVALLHLLTAIATLRTKMRRFSFAWTMAAEAIELAAFSCTEPWGVIALLGIGTIPPLLELKARGKPTRVYTVHMGLYVGLMILGFAMVELEGRDATYSLWAAVPLLLAVFIRSGIVPLHCWMTDLFEHATFGTSLLFVMRFSGAYAAVRLLLPGAPEWVLRAMGLVALTTAVYAAGMALVQREARRFFVYLFLSHSALILVGLEIATPIGLTGALSLWLSLGISLTGFGLTLRAIEARTGRVSLADFHGLYEQTRTLAAFFLLTGLASVGFPGTLGFLGTELLVEGAVEAYPDVGVAVVLAAMLNGIAVVKAYFYIFTGTQHSTSISLKMGMRERLAVLTLAALILGGGLFPRPGILSRYKAALEIVEDRETLSLQTPKTAQLQHGSDPN